MSKVKEVHGKPRLHVRHGRHVARLRRRRRRRRRAYASTSKMRKSTHGSPFLSYMSMGLRLAELRYNVVQTFSKIL